MSSESNSYSSSSAEVDQEKEKIYQQRLNKFLKHHQNPTLNVVQRTSQQQNNKKEQQTQQNQNSGSENYIHIMESERLKNLQVQEELADLYYRLQAHISQKEGIFSAYKLAAKEKVSKMEEKLQRTKQINKNNLQKYSQYKKNKTKQQVNQLPIEQIQKKDIKLCEKFKAKVNIQFENFIYKNVFPIIKSQPKTHNEFWKEQSEQIQEDGKYLAQYLNNYSKTHNSKLESIEKSAINQIQILSHTLIQNQIRRSQLRKKLEKQISSLDQKLSKIINDEATTHEKFTKFITKKIEQLCTHLALLDMKN